MANFDKDIKRISNEMLKDGTIDEIIRNKLKEAYEKAIDDAFRWGDLRDTIEKRIKEVMIPTVEKYDLSAYTTKLEDMLLDIVESTALPNHKKLLENFGTVMKHDVPQTVTLEDILEKYIKFCEEEIDCTGREVDPDSYGNDGPDYESGEATVELERDEQHRHMHDESKVCLHCFIDDEENEENKEDLERRLYLSRYDWESKEGYMIRYRWHADINGLSTASKFDVWLMALSQAGTRLVAKPGESESDMFTPSAKPEIKFE